eukprot:SAG22_NODE_1287_length_4872_cov_2.731615_3_plen_170_part_00
MPLLAISLDSHFEAGVGQLAQQIQQATQLECTGAHDEAGGLLDLAAAAAPQQSVAESVAELKRLEVDIKGAARANTGGGKSTWDDDGDGSSSWQDQPARLHSIIPEYVVQDCNSAPLPLRMSSKSFPVCVLDHRLPEDFRLTNDITMLTQLVLGQGKKTKGTVGFYGMG